MTPAHSEFIGTQCLFLESAASAALRLVTRKRLRSLLSDLTRPQFPSLLVLVADPCT